METPMQELIEKWMNTEYNEFSIWLVKNKEILIQKEKEAIIEAVNNTVIKTRDMQIPLGESLKFAKEYYNTKYNK